MSLLASSHTLVEQRLYEQMLAQSRLGNNGPGAFSILRLMSLTGIYSQSSIRRGRDGLLSKRSIERQQSPDKATGIVYRIFTPLEVFERRAAAGIQPYPKQQTRAAAAKVASSGRDDVKQLIEAASERFGLSRRQAQVAGACAEGLTNNDIARKLSIKAETVKFHLKHIFVKCEVKRRTELVALLLSPAMVKRGIRKR